MDEPLFIHSEKVGATGKKFSWCLVHKKLNSRYYAILFNLWNNQSQGSTLVMLYIAYLGCSITCQSHCELNGRALRCESLSGETQLLNQVKV